MTTKTVTYLPPCDACGHVAAQHQRELRGGEPVTGNYSCHNRSCKCIDWKAPVTGTWSA
jgi:hypothetical protein